MLHRFHDHDKDQLTDDPMQQHDHRNCRRGIPCRHDDDRTEPKQRNIRADLCYREVADAEHPFGGRGRTHRIQRPGKSKHGLQPYRPEHSGLKQRYVHACINYGNRQHYREAGNRVITFKSIKKKTSRNKYGTFCF